MEGEGERGEGNHFTTTGPERDETLDDSAVGNDCELLHAAYGRNYIHWL